MFEEESYESDKQSSDSVEEEPEIFEMNFADMNTGNASLSTYPKGKMTDKCWGVYAVQNYAKETDEYSSESGEAIFGAFSAKVYQAECEEYELNCQDP